MKIVAITSCPVGIAHTYIAAEKLTKTGKKLGVDIKVETQGSTGVENGLTEKEIIEADGVIIAADKTVNLDRFEGKKVLECPIAQAIKGPEKLIEKFVNDEVPVRGNKKASDEKKVITEKAKSKQPSFYKHLMGGVSYMIPVVVVGGLLIALALAFGGEPTAAGLVIPEGSIWKQVEAIGAAGFAFMVPVLSGFIAYSIADRPGLVPGLIGGYIAANGSFYGSEANAGFLGGIVTGFLAGYIAKWLKELKVPQMFKPVMPIIIIPIISTLVVGLLFILLLGQPIAAVFVGLSNFLESLSGAGTVVLATMLGAMMAFDMGGPVNKVAFLFGVSMLTEGKPEIMGSIAAAGVIPPLGMGLATLINRKLYSEEEQDAGKAALLMGFCGIGEGAIPFATVDPFRVIPSIMVGAVVAGNIAMFGGVTNMVPHCGPIVALMGAIDGLPIFFVAMIVGSIVTAFMVNFLKRLRDKKA